MPIKVLLVEDSPADARLIKELLAEPGAGRFLLTQADQLALALEKLAAETPDVLLLDLSLPDSKRLATFQRLHQTYPGLPVVVLTGLDDEDLGCQAVAEGASDYLLKNDVSSGLLTRALRYAIERQRSVDAICALNAGLEQRVRERTAQLEAANQEIEAFAYSVSHDLRAPLRVIAGYCQILAEEHAEGLSAEGKHYLTATCDQAARMRQLIDDLLEFSRLGQNPLRKTAVAPAEIAREALRELTPDGLPRDVQVEIGEMPPADADRTLLLQVFSNLLSNALKFTRKREKPRIEVGSLASGGNESTVYFVRDNGAGFDMRHADRLFGVFQRLHAEKDYEGTGAGLAIVRRIIHRHGGRIWAEAALDRGAAFYFTLGSGDASITETQQLSAFPRQEGEAR